MRTRYLFLLPMFIYAVLFFFIPVLFGMLLPFFSGEVNPQEIQDGSFSVLNYIESVSSGMGTSLIDAIRNTLIYTFCVSCGCIVLGLSGALLVTQKFPSVGIVRVLLMISWVVPTYIVGLLWGFMWQQDEGIINMILFDYLHWDQISGVFGATWTYLPDGSLVKPNWLTGPNTIWAIIVPAIWRNWPFCMMMFLSGLSAIPHDIYEASALDGIPPRVRFMHITLPILRPIFAVVVLESLVINMYSFNLVAMMFGNGSGFPGKFGDLIMTFLYRTSFQTWNFGAGAALGTISMLFMLICVTVWYRNFARELRNG